MLTNWAIAYRLDPALVRALAWMESGFQPGLVSSAGAPRRVAGAAEHALVRPVGADRHKVPRSTSGNIRIGVVYLRHLLREFDWQPHAALAAWYQGPARCASTASSPARGCSSERPSAAQPRRLSGLSGCGGGFESTRTAARAASPSPTALSPARLRGRPAKSGAPALEPRPDEEVVAAPQRERERDEPELHQQHAARSPASRGRRGAAAAAMLR